MNFWKELLTRLLALSGGVEQAGTERQNQGLTPPQDLTPSVEPKSLSDTKHTVLFEQIGGRHLNDIEPHGFFPDAAKQVVSFQSPEQLVNPGVSSVSFTQDGPKMRVIKTEKNKIKNRKNRGGKDRNLREEESVSNEEEQEYTTVAMRSDDGNAYAHCSVFPDGKAIACVQYVHNGVQNTTMLMIDPNDFGAHTLTTVTPEEQQAYFKDQKMEAPAIPAHEPDSRRRRLHQENQQNQDKSQLSRRITTGTAEFTMAVAVDTESINAFGGMSKAEAQVAIQVSLLNQLLQTSGLRLRIKLVSVFENTAIASGDTQRELLYATNNLDRGNADFLMSIIGNYGSSSAWLYNERPPNAAALKKQLVAVVRRNMLPGKTFQHEFGHLIAGQHQRQYSYTSGRRFPYAYAFSDYFEEVGDTLAYLRNPVDRFPVYSSATGVYDDVRIGDADTDDSRAMAIVTDEIEEILGNVSPAELNPTRRPTVAVYTAAPSVKVTAKPSVPSKAPSKRPTSKAPSNQASHAPSKQATTHSPTKQGTSKAPSKQATTHSPTKQGTSKAPSKQGTKVPTMPRTAKPTPKATATPTFDQTPLLPLNKLVDFSFKVDDPAANVPLTIQVGPARKITITKDRVTVLNAANAAVSLDNYVLNREVLKSIILDPPGKNNNFRLINTGTEINLYHVPLIKKRGKEVLGPPKLLLTLHKISATGNNMLGDDLLITFSRATSEFVNVGAIKNVATRAPSRSRGRLLEDNEAVPGAIINFIDFTKDPAGETKKLLSSQFEPVLKVIAGSPYNILKFIDDATFSLGEKEAYELMNSGVMSKIFELADEKTLTKVFKQLHSYHKVELIQYVNYRILDTHPIFKQASAMRAADLKYGEHHKEDSKNPTSDTRHLRS